MSQATLIHNSWGYKPERRFSTAGASWELPLANDLEQALASEAEDLFDGNGGFSIEAQIVGSEARFVARFMAQDYELDQKSLLAELFHEDRRYPLLPWDGWYSAALYVRVRGSDDRHHLLARNSAAPPPWPVTYGALLVDEFERDRPLNQAPQWVRDRLGETL